MRELQEEIKSLRKNTQDILELLVKNIASRSKSNKADDLAVKPHNQATSADTDTAALKAQLESKEKTISEFTQQHESA